MKNRSIDAVITWVDGSDPAHAVKLAEYVKHSASSSPECTRFAHHGEIDYCVRSLLQHAPFIQTIYIVTDNQTPDILKHLAGTPYETRVRLIDHRVIFSDFEDVLPVFNSLSIESMLWRIPGLSEEFIYLNDDCVLIRPVEYSDFFKDGKVVVRGSWKTPRLAQWLYRFSRWLPRSFGEKKLNPHRLLQENSAALAGCRERFLHLPHVPFALKKSTLADFFEKNPDSLRRNSAFPLRDPTQFWCVSVATHLEIKHHHAVLDNRLRDCTINPAHHSLATINKKLAWMDDTPEVAFLCLQSLDAACAIVRTRLFEWLAGRIDGGGCFF